MNLNSDRKKRGPRSEKKRILSRVGYQKRGSQYEEKEVVNRKSGMISWVLMIICVIVFLVSALQLFSIYKEYKSGKDSYIEVEELGITAPEVEVDEDGNEIETPYEYYYVNFDTLMDMNPDTIGWIRFDSPDISYPIVQTTDNSTYLTNTFEGGVNSSGAIFVDMKNSSNFTDDNTIIYGHNMKNDTMFGALSAYNDGAFYEEYPYFYIYTPDGKATKYQVVAAEVISATDSERYTINFADVSSYQSYIDKMLSTSYYDTGTEIDVYSKLVTLSTCTGSDDTRFIVQGVKVESKDMIVPE